jgi:hypothetical protein
MNLEDVKSLSAKTREDGQRLFGVCEVMYIISMVGTVLFGLVGLAGAIIASINVSVWLGVGIAVFTVIFCIFSYMIAVLSTHFGKVAVHISFASVGLLEHFTKQ